jgi:hypothetical protein
MAGDGGLQIKEVKTLQSFDKDYKKLSLEIKKQANERLKSLLENPLPKKLRFEKLKDHKNPAVYTIHVTANHSHKASMEIKGEVAFLRRIGTHKKIDKEP